MVIRQRRLFGSTLREPPKDAETVNHRLLVQAGFVDQLMAGVFTYLPLGLMVLDRIRDVVRKEMNAIGGQELLMPMLHPKSIWERTGGWESIDVLFKLLSRTGKEYALGQSEEEVVTPLVMERVHSYKDFPLAVYQIHWKFRDELRAKSGLLRGREFLMKDLYSFHVDQEDFERYYETVKEAYLKIFSRLGLVAKITEASGGVFSEKVSYEFMVLTDAGEDEVLSCDSCTFCVNVDIAAVGEGQRCPHCSAGTLVRAKAAEVGNVFDLGQKYGKDFGLTFAGPDGKQHHPVIGCYGFGISRAMATVVERHHDDRGLLWPPAIAPADVHVLSLNADDAAGSLADALGARGLAVLLDDREGKSAGEKFADSDLIGIPVQVVVSERGLQDRTVEVRPRKNREEGVRLPLDEAERVDEHIRQLLK